MPDQRGPSFAYPATTVDESDPKLIERRRASKEAYDAAIAAGKGERVARLEAAKADARAVRIMAGLDPGDEDDAAYERAIAERKARGKRSAKKALSRRP